MFHIGFIERLEEAIVCTVGYLGILHVCIDFCFFPTVPKLLSTFKRRTLFICISSLEILNVNRSIALVDFLKLCYLLGTLIFFPLFQLLPYFI
jgi:hypothetical protein